MPTPLFDSRENRYGSFETLNRHQGLPNAYPQERTTTSTTRCGPVGREPISTWLGLASYARQVLRLSAILRNEKIPEREEWVRLWKIARSDRFSVTNYLDVFSNLSVLGGKASPQMLHTARALSPVALAINCAARIKKVSPENRTCGESAPPGHKTKGVRAPSAYHSLSTAPK